MTTLANIQLQKMVEGEGNLKYRYTLTKYAIKSRIL